LTAILLIVGTLVQQCYGVIDSISSSRYNHSREGKRHDLSRTVTIFCSHFLCSCLSCCVNSVQAEYQLLSVAGRRVDHIPRSRRWSQRTGVYKTVCQSIPCSRQR